ncbi:MAG: hypothetical protein ACKVP0_07340 [Pirellulaceae bacterium]
MTSPQDLPPPEKPASHAAGKNPAASDAKPQAEKPPAKKRSKIPLLLFLFAMLFAPIAGVGGWLVFGQPNPDVVEPGKPIPPEPPAPPPPFKATLATEETSAAEAGSEDGLAKTTEQISTIAAGLPSELLLASVDGSAPARLIASGSLERSTDAISRIPRHERWEIRIGAGNTSDSYTRQLDFFKIELGVIGQANDIVYLSNLSAPNPTNKTQSAAGEKRLYLIWQRGSMREADEEILARAKIPAAGKVVVHFCPEELENELVKLEDDQAKQSGLKRIRKTVFGVRPKEPEGFRFFVIEQKADE